MFLDMVKKVNFNLALLALLLASIMSLEMMCANKNNFFSTDTVIHSVSSWHNIESDGVEINDNSFSFEKSNCNIDIPFTGKYSYVKINMTPYDGNGLVTRLYCQDRKSNNYVKSKKVTVNRGDDSLLFNTGKKSGGVRIQFLFEDKPARIEMKNIEFHMVSLRMSELFAFKSICVFLILYTITLLILVTLKRFFAKSGCYSLVEKLLIGGNVITIISLFVTGSYFWASYFLWDTTDSFMDYFNMLDLVSNENPYYLDSNYPPFCFLILKFMHGFFNSTNLVISDPKALRNSNAVSLMGFLALLTLCIVTIHFCIKGVLKDNNIKRTLVLLFTGPMFFLIERGNMLIIALVFLMLYIRFYDSESTKLRYVAYTALAISAAIKVYPALFGIMSLRRKRIKESFHMVIIGITLFILPFFYFDGVNTIRAFLKGLASASKLQGEAGLGYNYSIQNFIKIIGTMIGSSFSIPKVLLVLIIILLLLIALLNRREWESLFLIATACIWFPDFSYTYTLVLYLPALLAYVYLEEKNKIDGICLSIVQMPIFLPMMPWVDSLMRVKFVSLKMSYSTLIINMCIIFLTIRIIIRFAVKYYVSQSKEAVYLRVITAIEIVACCSLVILLAFGTYNRNYNDKYKFEGCGTRWNPYLIKNADDLIYLMAIVNDGDECSDVFFSQTNDIELDGQKSMNPIGWDALNASFDGVYNGNGYEIKNYYSLSENDENMGLFGVLDGEVYNVCLSNCNIMGSISGGIAYKVTGRGSIINCSVNGRIFGYKAGGISAVNEGVIENSVAFVLVEATQGYGLAHNSGGKCINSFTNTDMNVEKYNYIDDKTINCLNDYVSYNNKVFENTSLSRWAICEGFFKLEALR